ncbi:hypothetical protein JRO89_XS15G0113700 [Xanthoceras sorbifolium]|uniref:F-box domain-containing protein n=1 Tax=Xanthoceras sorbifolium TaxID=99658 RepID=A0ABQ8H1P3_9ROSI|nr:hypothetical protein JRO89_XS15G0113700 [Xanthoceras sorbifolium]
MTRKEVLAGMFWKISFRARRNTHTRRASKDKDEGKASNIGSMSELPLAILMDILSRLPIKTILECKCVCRTWFNLVSDPYFAQMHLARAPVSILLLTNLQQRSTYSGDFLVPLLRSNRIGNLSADRLSLLTSCNGLLCLHDLGYKKDEISVCNPFLREHMVLPQVRSKRILRRIIGFGITQSTNQYKLIQILNSKNQAENSDKFQVEIFTLGTDMWRNNGFLPYQLIQPSYGAFSHGALHWYAHSHDKKTLMCSFDLENEQFQPFPGPPIQDHGQCRPVNSISVGVSGDFLYLCDGFRESNIDIWVMKNYGEKGSWTKEFSVANPLVSKLQRIFGSIHILNYGLNMNMSEQATEDAEILMLFGSEEVLAYKVRSKGVRKPRTFSIQSNYQAIPYTASLVSIKDAVMEVRPRVKHSPRGLLHTSNLVSFQSIHPT